MASDVSDAQWSPERLVTLAGGLEWAALERRLLTVGESNEAAAALRDFARVVSVLTHVTPQWTLEVWTHDGVEPPYLSQARLSFPYLKSTPTAEGFGALAAILALADALAGEQT